MQSYAKYHFKLFKHDVQNYHFKASSKVNSGKLQEKKKKKSGEKKKKTPQITHTKVEALTSTKLLVIKCWYFSFTFESVINRLEKDRINIVYL